MATYGNIGQHMATYGSHNDGVCQRKDPLQCATLCTSYLLRQPMHELCHVWAGAEGCIEVLPHVNKWRHFPRLAHHAWGVPGERCVGLTPHVGVDFHTHFH